MKKLRFLSMLLLVALLLCSAALAEEDYHPFAETVDVSILGTVNAVCVYDSANPARESANVNEWINAYKEYLNIDVTRRLAEDATSRNAVLNTGMASGNLPDIMIVPADMFYVLAENGVLKDLSEAYESCKDYTYLKMITDVAGEDVINRGTIDGEMLGFPMLAGSYSSTQVLWVRQDWLNKVNKEVPTTIDEMIDVAKAFKEAKLGGEKTIPIGMANDDLYHDFRGILAAYGAVYGTWMQQEDGSYVFGNVCDQMRDGLLKLQEMYADGLFKSDFAVTNIINEEVANSQIGMYFATGWHAVTELKANMLNDPEAEWVCTVIPTLDGNPVDQYTNGGISTYLVVNANYEHPEVLFKMLNLEMKFYYYPTNEESLKYHTCEDGYAMWNNRVFRDFSRTDKDMYLSELINAALDEKKDAAEVDPAIRDWYTQVLKAQNGEREFIGRLLCQTSAYPKVSKLMKQGLLHMPYDGPITETMQLYLNTINVELNNATIRVIMGEDIGTFDKAVSDWYANGGQTITDEINAYYLSK